jgi:hypothetical protein
VAAIRLNRLFIVVSIGIVGVPYKRHTVSERVLYVKRVEGKGSRCLAQGKGDCWKPNENLPFKMAIVIPAGILEELKISIQCPYREPDGRRDRKGRINTIVAIEQWVCFALGITCMALVRRGWAWP